MYEHQPTGVRDKNGKEMTEGDIVSGLFLYESPINGVVKFQDGAFGLEWERGGAKQFNPFVCMCNVSYEVVGSIYTKKAEKTQRAYDIAEEQWKVYQCTEQLRRRPNDDK